jgi:PD-(D/E)XK endonuclease
MGRTTRKGEIGEAMVLADLQRKGYAVAIPFGHDLPFDLILIRRDTGGLERVQCKYTESDGTALDVRCGSSSAWVRRTYGPHEVDWIAVYDATTSCCYYVHSTVWGGLARPRLRLAPAANGQRRGIRPAAAFLYPELDPRTCSRDAGGRLAMLAGPPPE